MLTLDVCVMVIFDDSFLQLTHNLNVNSKQASRMFHTITNKLCKFSIDY